MGLNLEKKLKFHRNLILSVLLLVGIVFSVITIVYATTPDPGHNYTEASGGIVQGDLLYGSATDTLSALTKDTNATRYLSNTGASNNPAWAQINLANGVTGTLANGNIATALTGKTYNGLTLSAIVGGFTINGGTLVTRTLTVTGDATISGTPLSNPMTTLGDIMYGGAAGVVTRLGGTTGFLKSTGAAAPTWNTVNLATADVTGILPTANGGTNMAFFTVAGPTVARTFTFPDSSATVLTDNADVTVAQGGTGLSTLTAHSLIIGNGASNVLFTAPSTTGNILVSNGTDWTSGAGGVLIGRQVKVSGDTTYTATSGTLFIIIQMVGGGAGGGGATGTATSASLGGGGGGGGYAEKKFVLGTASSATIAVGASGAGGIGANGTGTAGGNSTFACCGGVSTTVTAFGGSGGVTETAGTTIQSSLGGAGGVVSTGGDINATGQPGGFAQRATASLGVTGAGAPSHFGGGGNSKNTGSIGNGGGGYGSGGGGAMSINTTSFAGGDGKAGVIIIMEYR